MEYQQIAAGCFCSVLSTDVLVPFLWVGVSWKGAGRGGPVFVFGTLLGPEATGPGCVACEGCVVFPVLCVSGFLAAWFRAWRLSSLLWGGSACGVYGTGLLFENYIVDASI